ncbi:MAG: beta-galactosidase [Verrucomicrobiota bacterium JB024]|nr:beta-galactosidase [Verrucomicrobiota bacterium JB024]
MKIVSLWVCAAVLLAVAPCRAQSGPVDEQWRPRGIYSLMWAPHALRQGVPPCFELDYIDGATLYMPWAEIEPEPGNIRWELIDNCLDVARREGKVVNLGFFGGHYAPQWVIDNCPTWTNPSQHMHAGMSANNAAAKVVYPLPWTDEYLDPWFTFIGKVAERYGDDSNVGYLMLSGPGGQAIEMGYRIKDEHFEDFREKSGYSARKIIDAWKRVIDFYAKCWTHKPVCINIAMIPGDKGTKKTMQVPLAVEAYALEVFGDRALFINTYLNAIWFEKQDMKKPGDHAAPMVYHFRALSNYATTGGEMFWSSSEPDESVNGPLGGALQVGDEWGMTFFHVYQSDIAPFGATEPRPDYARAMRQERERLGLTSE